MGTQGGYDGAMYHKSGEGAMKMLQRGNGDIMKGQWRCYEGAIERIRMRH